MKNLKRLFVMFLTVIMLASLCALPAFAANANQDALHEAAEILRNDLGLPNDHAAVRVLSEAWSAENGTNLSGSYYYSGRTGKEYYFGRTNSGSGSALYTGGYKDSNRRQVAAAKALNLVSGIYGQSHPVTAAMSDVLASECGVLCNLSYYYASTNTTGTIKYYYFSGSYQWGNNTTNKDDGQTNNTQKQPGTTSNNNGTGNGTTATTGDYAFYAAQNYYGGVLTGTDKYVDCDAAVVIAKFISSYSYNEASWTRQAAMGWILINYCTGRGYSEATVKAVFPDYNPNAPTTDSHGHDLLILAKDLLFRRNAERAGVAECGRVLPKDYARLWIADDTVYFRNQTGESAPNWGFTLKSPYSN